MKAFTRWLKTLSHPDSFSCRRMEKRVSTQFAPGHRAVRALPQYCAIARTYSLESLFDESDIHSQFFLLFFLMCTLYTTPEASRQMMQMNWNVMDSSRNRKQVSRSWKSSESLRCPRIPSMVWKQLCVMVAVSTCLWMHTLSNRCIRRQA